MYGHRMTLLSMTSSEAEGYAYFCCFKSL